MRAVIRQMPSLVNLSPFHDCRRTQTHTAFPYCCPEYKIRVTKKILGLANGNQKRETPDRRERVRERERKQLSVISRQPIGGVHYSGRVWCGVTLVFRDGTILDLQALCVK